MTDSIFLVLAVILGMASYPLFANRLANQRQNAAGVIGVALMGSAVLASSNVPALSHGTNLHAAIMLLSFVFFSSAYLGRINGAKAKPRTGWAPFTLGILTAIIGLNLASPTSYAGLIVVQAVCLFCITTTYQKLPFITFLKAGYFITLYSLVNALFHLGSSSEYGALVPATLVDSLFFLLMASSILHMVFQDISRIRTGRGLETCSKVDQEVMKFAFRSRRVLKDFQHDLRQPLSTLGILASVGKALSQDPEVSARYQHIQTAQKALKNMLEDFFDQLGQTIQYPQAQDNASLEPVSVDEVLAPLIEEYRLLADVKELEIRYVPTKLKVLTNKEALSKILRNGLDNAVKYTLQGGVVVGVRRRQGKICIQIVDTGSGIENNKVALQNKGWGYGSNIIRTLSELIQAKTECRNRQLRGKVAGSVFEVILPEDHEVKQREKHAEFIHRTSFAVQVMATSHQELLEIQKCLPVEGFGKVEFSLNGAYRAYLSALRKGMAPVYIMYVGEPEKKQYGLEQLSLLYSLLDFNPCCILIYNASKESNPQIEFGKEIIQIPLLSTQGSSNLGVISELFPNRNPPLKKSAPRSSPAYHGQPDGEKALITH